MVRLVPVTAPNTIALPAMGATVSIGAASVMSASTTPASLAGRSSPQPAIERTTQPRPSMRRASTGLMTITLCPDPTGFRERLADRLRVAMRRRERALGEERDVVAARPGLEAQEHHPGQDAAVALVDP